jgi:hypothetical protein
MNISAIEVAKQLIIAADAEITFESALSNKAKKSAVSASSLLGIDDKGRLVSIATDISSAGYDSSDETDVPAINARFQQLEASSMRTRDSLSAGKVTVEQEMRFSQDYLTKQGITADSNKAGGASYMMLVQQVIDRL